MSRWASSIARSTDRPARRPARASSRLAPSPTVSSTSMPCTVGPTTSSCAAARTRASAAAARTISGPMPRTSPSVTASRGRSVTTRRGSARRRGGERRQVDRLAADRDVALLAEGVEVAPHTARLGEAGADLLLDLGKSHVAALLDRVDLSDDDLDRNVGVAWDVEHDDLLRLLSLERLLVLLRQPGAREGREQRGLLSTPVVVVLLRKRVERCAGAPSGGYAVALQARSGDVGGVDLGRDEDVARLDLAGIDAIDADDVVAERGLDDGAERSRDERVVAEQVPVELGHHLSTTSPAEITAVHARSRVGGLALGDRLEVGASLDLGEQRLGVHSRTVLRLGGRTWGDDDLSPGDARLTLGEIVLALLERLLHLGVGDVQRHELPVLAQLARRPREQLVAADSISDEAPILLGRAIAGFRELRLEFGVAAEPAADRLELLVHGAVDVGVRNLGLELLRLLEQQLFVDQLVERRDRCGAERRGIRGNRHAALRLRDETLPEIRLGDDHVVDDGDNPVERNGPRRGNGGGDGSGRLATRLRGGRLLRRERGGRQSEQHGGSGESDSHILEVPAARP